MKSSLGNSKELKKVHIMIKPPQDWLTQPPCVAADGDLVMLKAILAKKTHPAGSGAKVIQHLASLYKELGLHVALFESSKAAQRVSKRIIGQPNPDDVFTVDCLTGHELEYPANHANVSGDKHSLDSGKYANVINRMSAATRSLEPFVMQIIATRLGVKNIFTQPKEAKFEGGDFTFLPHALGESKSLLVTGGGVNSRSNEKGRQWLTNVLQPKNHLTVVSTEFHRDLVSVFVQDTRGKLVQAPLALDCIQNQEEVISKLKSLGVDIVPVPEEAVPQCAVNLLVHPGLLVGMQSHAKLTEVIENGLPPGVTYHALPSKLHSDMAGFIDMQGGANCVSGHVLVDPEDDLDISAENIAKINSTLHSKDLEDYLQAKAEEIGMKEAVEEAKIKQFQVI